LLTTGVICSAEQQIRDGLCAVWKEGSITGWKGAAFFG